MCVYGSLMQQKEPSHLCMQHESNEGTQQHQYAGRKGHAQQQHEQEAAAAAAGGNVSAFLQTGDRQCQRETANKQ